MTRILIMNQAEKTQAIIAAFYEVYNALGYGFIENVYQNALYKELQKWNIPCIAHPKITVYYKDEPVGYYEADIVAYDSVILELKAVSHLVQEHELQLVNYLKATDIEVGLLLNFGPKPEVSRKVFSHYYRDRLAEKNKSASSASSASEESCGLRHPELFSGSVDASISNQESGCNQMLKQVQHDKMVKDEEKNKSASSASSASKKSCGLRHPELGSGSEEPNNQMLKQVQHDKG